MVTTQELQSQGYELIKDDQGRIVKAVKQVTFKDRSVEKTATDQEIYFNPKTGAVTRQVKNVLIERPSGKLTRRFVRKESDYIYDDKGLAKATKFYFDQRGKKTAKELYDRDRDIGRIVDFKEAQRVKENYARVKEQLKTEQASPKSFDKRQVQKGDIVGYNTQGQPIYATKESTMLVDKRIEAGQKEPERVTLTAGMKAKDLIAIQRNYGSETAVRAAKVVSELERERQSRTVSKSFTQLGAEIMGKDQRRSYRPVTPEEYETYQKKAQVSISPKILKPSYNPKVPVRTKEEITMPQYMASRIEARPSILSKPGRIPEELRARAVAAEQAGKPIESFLLSAAGGAAQVVTGTLGLLKFDGPRTKEEATEFFRRGRVAVGKAKELKPSTLVSVASAGLLAVGSRIRRAPVTFVGEQAGAIALTAGISKGVSVIQARRAAKTATITSVEGAKISEVERVGIGSRGAIEQRGIVRVGKKDLEFTLRGREVKLERTAFVEGGRVPKGTRLTKLELDVGDVKSFVDIRQPSKVRGVETKRFGLFKQTFPDSRRSTRGVITTRTVPGEPTPFVETPQFKTTKIPVDFETTLALERGPVIGQRGRGVILEKRFRDIPRIERLGIGLGVSGEQAKTAQFIVSPKFKGVDKLFVPGRSGTGAALKTRTVPVTDLVSGAPQVAVKAAAIESFTRATPVVSRAVTVGTVSKISGITSVPKGDVFVEPPAQVPTARISAVPRLSPVVAPSAKIIPVPSVRIRAIPSVIPALKPSVKPTIKPSVTPIIKPSVRPSIKPTIKPIVKPVVKPVVKPIVKPVVKPIVRPVTRPIVRPVIRPILPIPITPPPIIPPRFINKRKKKKKLKVQTVYTPQLFAVVGGIKGKVSKKRKTGLEIRPVLSVKKSKR